MLELICGINCFFVFVVVVVVVAFFWGLVGCWFAAVKYEFSISNRSVQCYLTEVTTRISFIPKVQC